MLNKKYIAAVSGGPDSMAMLDMYKKHIRAVCHVNYNKRDTSKRDELLIEKYCELNNIDFYCFSALKSENDADNNFQQWARKIRYDFFAKISEKENGLSLLVAHNLDDFIETAIMQQNKKSDLLFWGIKKRSRIGNLKIYRPLINVRKKTLENYCIKNNIEYGIDETNFEDLYTRNKIRKDIVKWSKCKFYRMFIWIKLFNLKKSCKRKRIAKMFFQWITSSYDINFFVKKSNALRSNLIYELLNKFEISYSKQKFDLVNDYIDNGKVNTKLRLGNNSFLSKTKDNKLIIINQK